MSTPALAPNVATQPHSTAPQSASTKNGRGKENIAWSEAVWRALDHSLKEELVRTRVVSKFVPHVHVGAKDKSVPSDIVTVPAGGAAGAVVGAGAAPDPALFIDESDTTRIQEYFTTIRLSKAQVETEEHDEEAFGYPLAMAHHDEKAAVTDQHHSEQIGHHARASSAISLTMQAANIIGQGEDLVLLNGQNAVVNSALFQGGAQAPIQSNDPQLAAHLDYGLANINPNGPGVAGGPVGPDIAISAGPGNLGLFSIAQVIVVHPTVPAAGGAPPLYRENTLNAVAQAVAMLQGFSHYEHYALVLHTVPYADLHQALPATLIQPVEPISHLVKAGVYGTGTLPPFVTAPAGGAGGLPISINNGRNLNTIANWAPATQVLYTGVLVSLSGMNVDLVRGRMDGDMDAIINYETKAAGGQHYFRVVQRFALRLKINSAVALLVFVDR